MHFQHTPTFIHDGRQTSPNSHHSMLNTNQHQYPSAQKGGVYIQVIKTMIYDSTIASTKSICMDAHQFYAHVDLTFMTI